MARFRGSPQAVRAEMVASVHSVLVEVGDSVESGDTLVLLESMKMEIPVVVEEPGIVLEIAVSPGDVVREGDVIAMLQ